MTDTPASTPKKQIPPAFTPKEKQCSCGDWFITKARNHQYCTPACRIEANEARTGQKAGGGRPDQTKKELRRAASIVAMEAAGVELSEAVKRLPKELQYTSQRGLPHAAPLTEDDPRCDRFLMAFAQRGDVSDAAQQADGRPGTGRAFRNLFEKSKLLNSDFHKRWQEALDSWGAIVHQAVVDEAVIGREVFAASMGTAVSLGRQRDGKLLAQLKRQTDKEFQKANSAAGASVTVNVNAGANPNPDDPQNPSFTFWLKETFFLSDDDRAYLSRIAKRILSMRAEEDVEIDLTPDVQTQALLTEIRNEKESDDDEGI